MSSGFPYFEKVTYHFGSNPFGYLDYAWKLMTSVDCPNLVGFSASSYLNIKKLRGLGIQVDQDDRVWKKPSS